MTALATPSNTEAIKVSLKEPVYLAAAAARTATLTGDWVKAPVAHKAAIFTIDVTAAATESSDKLEPVIQAMVDGTNPVDVVRFNDILGDGGAKRYIVKINGEIAQAMFENGSALTSTNIRNLLGEAYRVSVPLTDAGTDNASFTYSVTAIFL